MGGFDAGLAVLVCYVTYMLLVPAVAAETHGKAVEFRIFAVWGVVDGLVVVKGRVFPCCFAAASAAAEHRLPPGRTAEVVGCCYSGGSVVLAPGLREIGGENW